VCVVDEQGAVLMQCSVATVPEAIAKALAPFAATLRRVGHEAGSLSPWLHPALQALGVPVVCLETRQVRVAMSAQRNKTDATDVLGLAHPMRIGWFRQAHVKSEGAYRLKLLLTHRRNLKRKLLDLENAIRHSLKSFGVKLHKVGRGGFAQAVRDACAADPFTAELMDCMLTARGGVAVTSQAARSAGPAGGARRAVPSLHGDPRRRPGDRVDLPHGGRRSGAVPALARRRGLLRADVEAMAVGHLDRRAGPHQQGRRSRGPARAVRGRQRHADALQRQGGAEALGPEDRQALPQKAVVAMARKLAVLMHAMWRDGTVYADRQRAGRGAAGEAAPASGRRRMTFGDPITPQAGAPLSA
jgi:transposase